MGKHPSNRRERRTLRLKDKKKREKKKETFPKKYPGDLRQWEYEQLRGQYKESKDGYGQNTDQQIHSG